MTEQQAPAPLALPPRFAPVPTAVSVIGAQYKSQPVVILRAEHPTGTTVFGWPPDEAEAIGTKIVEAAKAARANLAVTQSRLIVPGR